MWRAKTLIRLGGCPGWSVFVGRTGHFVGFVMWWLKYHCPIMTQLTYNTYFVWLSHKSVYTPCRLEPLLQLLSIFLQDSENKKEVNVIMTRRQTHSAAAYLVTRAKQNHDAHAKHVWCFYEVKRNGHPSRYTYPDLHCLTLWKSQSL